MQHRTVSDVMTHQVATVRRDAPFKAVAELLAERDVSAVPVVDDAHRVVGVVSEGDLLRKESGQPDPEGHTPSLWMSPSNRKRARAENAEGLMSHTVFSARPEWSVVEAARMMDRHHVKRLPVVDETDRLVGIVSRSDLLRVFLRDDRAIRGEIISEVLQRVMLIEPATVSVEVKDGVVSLQGQLERKSLIPITERLCRSVDGVVGLRSRLTFAFDDTHTDLEPPVVRGVMQPQRFHG
ncbi:inosine-5'-monophosphate dehydrogenase [Streptacidiphilus pinicola]|uniref:Inosine-5'-monophosphate dehydrogenase n=1 Tax=Streptacidiphilus pinicola TaxID=2219663 RepID=A0A2X0IQ98_9ACTN|nr:CBS domain-containing protein [Streptacidiphilus pinicola]RAG86817.1 inosine-5'-monophosphate dehydrogenase [Streptacidiphilus pinicola]